MIILGLDRKGYSLNDEKIIHHNINMRLLGCNLNLNWSCYSKRKYQTVTSMMNKCHRCTRFH